MSRTCPQGKGSLLLVHKVKDRYCNVSCKWVQIFTRTCPGCIVRAPKPKLLAGLHNIITLGLGVRGQCDIVDLQSMADGMFKFLLNYTDYGVKFLSLFLWLQSKLVALH